MQTGPRIKAFQQPSWLWSTNGIPLFCSHWGWRDSHNKQTVCGNVIPTGMIKSMDTQPDYDV